LSNPLYVWFYGGVFGVGGSNGAISGFAKSEMAALPKSDLNSSTNHDIKATFATSTMFI